MSYRSPGNDSFTTGDSTVSNPEPVEGTEGDGQVVNADTGDSNPNSVETSSPTVTDNASTASDLTTLETPMEPPDVPQILSSTPATEPTLHTGISSGDSITTENKPDSYADSDSGGGGGGLSNSTKVAIAVPVAIVGALILAAIAFFLLRRRRKRQRLQSKPVISSPQLETSSSVFLRTAAAASPSARTPAPIPRRLVPQAQDPAPPPHDPPPPETAAATAAATRDLNRQSTSEEGAGDTIRPRSPFDHPHDNDDAHSVVSVMSDPDAMIASRRHRDDDNDDLSSVSSFEDEPRPVTSRGG
ncbi:hypothetical protein BJX61DRAFT_220358 [Aspergillus egyptiacus]|nr:hypothetical protein BJX61DRAFT_220358 [Aspergillus egyptiacus]